MNIATEREKLAQKLLEVTDYQLLAAIRNLLDFGLKRQENSISNDFWDDLTDEQKARIQRSIDEVENGGGIPHEEVMAEFRKKNYNFLQKSIKIFK